VDLSHCRQLSLAGSVDPEIDRVGLNDRSTAIFDRLDRSTRLSPTLSTQLDSGQRRSTRSTCQFTPHSGVPGRRYETIEIYIQYLVTVVTVSCDRIIGCSLNLWFTFILYKTRSSAVAVIADHTAYDVRYTGKLSDQFRLLSAIRFNG